MMAGKTGNGKRGDARLYRKLGDPVFTPPHGFEHDAKDAGEVTQQVHFCR